HDGARNGTHQVANVELNDLVARAFPGVCDRDADLSRVIYSDPRWINLQIGISEGRIAQTKAKREQRLFVCKQVTAARGRLAIVVERQLAHRARKTYSQLA